MPEDTAVSIAGIARIDAPEPVWIARSQTHIAELSLLCGDPAMRDRVAVYVGGERRTWYMPAGSNYEFFESGEVKICPRNDRLTFIVNKEIYDGFLEHRGVLPTEFSVVQNGYDPDLARRGHPLPLHFHWVFLGRASEVPSAAAVHCSTEKFKRDVTVVGIKAYRQPRR